MDVHTVLASEHCVGVRLSYSTVQGSNLEPLNMRATDTVLRNVANHQPSAQRHMPDNRNPRFIVSLHLLLYRTRISLDWVLLKVKC
jgi:hypothetical protein